MLKKYLIVSSVIFHIIFLVSLYWVVPFFSRTAEMASRNVDSFQNPEVGTIESVSTLNRKGIPYNGYKIGLDGQSLYVTGNGDETYRVGDEVDLSITEHPYEPLNTLMINIMGVSR